MLLERLFAGRDDGSFRLLDNEIGTLLGHVRRLSPEQIHARFMADMDDAALMRWARASTHHDVIGWFIEDTLRATIEIGYRGDRTECAVTCEEDSSDRRIGRQLFSRARTLARERAALKMLDHPGWMVSRCYARSIIVPHAEPANPLWLVRGLKGGRGLLDRLISRSSAPQS